MSAITRDSGKPNWASMASKGVRSSQAISMTRLISSTVSLNTGLSLEYNFVEPVNNIFN
jgi:hypothetical protein